MGIVQWGPSAVSMKGAQENIAVDGAQNVYFITWIGSADLQKVPLNRPIPDISCHTMAISCAEILE